MKEAPIIPSRKASHGSKSEKPYQRACLRDLGRTWPSGRSSRSALAGGGAGSARGIDGGARPKIRAAKEEVRCATQEAASAGTCEDQQHPRRGKLTPRSDRPWIREHGSLNKRCALASVPIPKFATLCGMLVCELLNRRTLATY